MKEGDRTMRMYGVLSLPLIRMVTALQSLKCMSTTQRYIRQKPSFYLKHLSHFELIKKIRQIQLFEEIPGKITNFRGNGEIQLLVNFSKFSGIHSLIESNDFQDRGDRLLC